MDVINFPSDLNLKKKLPLLKFLITQHLKSISNRWCCAAQRSFNLIFIYSLNQQKKHQREGDENSGGGDNFDFEV